MLLFTCKSNTHTHTYIYFQRGGVGVLGRLDSEYGVGLTVGRLDKWTPAPPDLVISAIRINLALLAHCALNDRQLPSICLRLKRFTHYLVWMDSSEDESLNDWVVTTVLHVHAKLVMIRQAVHGDNTEDLVKKPTPGEEGDSSVFASDDADSKDYSGLGFRQQLSDGSRSAKKKKTPSKVDLARSSFWHRAFPHSNWMPYSGNENALIGAALAANPEHGRVALHSNEEGVTYEIIWDDKGIVEVNTSTNKSNGLSRMVKRVDPFNLSDSDRKQVKKEGKEGDVEDAKEKELQEMEEVGYSESDNIWKNEKLESMLVSGRILFGVLDGFWRVRRELLEPLLQVSSARALGRLLAAVRKGEKVAASASARADDDSRRKKGEPAWEELGADFEVIEPLPEDQVFDDKNYLCDVIKWLTSSFLSDETSLLGTDRFAAMVGNLHVAEVEALEKHKATLSSIWDRF